MKFTYKDSSFAYNKFGSGESALLCLHGFGQSAQYFKFLEASWGHKYSIYAIDFFYHGDTEAPTSNFLEQFDQKVLVELFSKFLDEIKVKKCSLIGYSMGARLSLSLIEKIPESFSTALLIAPDGIYDSFWFRVSTKTKIGLLLFDQFTKNPGPFFSLMNLFISIGLISKKKRKFALQNTDTAEKRSQVQNTWKLLSKLDLNRMKIGQSIDLNNINFQILLGEYDHVILKDKLLRWKWLQNNQLRLNIIEAGHLIKSEKILDFIALKNVL